LNHFHYLNSGMNFGKAKDFLQIYSSPLIQNLDPSMDDQAELTKLFMDPNYRNLFYLDYEQVFFSNSNAWDSKDGCFFEWDESSQAFRNTKTNTIPFIIQTPAKHWSCYDLLSAKLLQN